MVNLKVQYVNPVVQYLRTNCANVKRDSFTGKVEFYNKAGEFIGNQTRNVSFVRDCDNNVSRITTIQRKIFSKWPQMIQKQTLTIYEDLKMFMGKTPDEVAKELPVNIETTTCTLDDLTNTISKVIVKKVLNPTPVLEKVFDNHKVYSHIDNPNYAIDSISQNVRHYSDNLKL